MKPKRMPALNLSSFVRRGLMLSLAAALGVGSLCAADDVVAVGFDKLGGFEFKSPEDSQPEKVAAAAAAQIPEKVRVFDDKKVLVTGFMLPVKMDAGLVTEFLLMKDQSTCCF